MKPPIEGGRKCDLCGQIKPDVIYCCTAIDTTTLKDIKDGMKELKKTYPILKKCGCIVLSDDGSKIACLKHESKKLKELAKKAVVVARA